MRLYLYCQRQVTHGGPRFSPALHISLLHECIHDMRHSGAAYVEVARQVAHHVLVVGKNRQHLYLGQPKFRRGLLMLPFF